MSCKELHATTQKDGVDKDKVDNETSKINATQMLNGFNLESIFPEGAFEFNVDLDLMEEDDDDEGDDASDWEYEPLDDENNATDEGNPTSEDKPLEETSKITDDGNSKSHACKATEKGS